MRRAAVRFGAAALTLLLAACTGLTGSSSVGPSGSAPTSAATRSLAVQVKPGGAPTAAAAIRDLCAASQPATPTTTPSASASPAATPPQIAAIESDVERATGLTFIRPVVAEPVTQQEMASKIEASFDQSYPAEYYARRTLAWRTIGVIPPDADLREALRTFLTGQVAGFYDQETKELVYLDDGGDLSLTERITLAHELTHAIDDQYYDLTRLDTVAGRCQDERYMAALGAVEGTAQYDSIQTIVQDPSSLSLGDAVSALIDALGSQGTQPAGVPPFVTALETWPYTAGQTFVTALALRGGNDAIDGALQRLPTTTAEILHPELYPPTGRPARVDVPDLTGALGPAWGDLDAEQVGEAWLAVMLSLRLDSSTANAAAAGWNGGVYRAFSDGAHVAVVMATAWETTADAQAFAGATTRWLGSQPGFVIRNGERVTVGFASDSTTLSAVHAAISSQE
jgi:hypothetical protein